MHRLYYEERNEIKKHKVEIWLRSGFLLHELFVGIFALQAGLINVVQAALVGSILGNSLLVLGLAFFVGGLRHGTQRFASQTPRMIATLTLLAVAALVVPTLVHNLHTPAAGHEEGLS